MTGCVPLNARRRSASCVVEGVQSDSTHSSTQLDVELSCVAINGTLRYADYFTYYVSMLIYLRRRLASGGVVTLGVTLSRCLCVRRINLGGDGNALYPVLSSLSVLIFVSSLIKRR